MAEENKIPNDSLEEKTEKISGDEAKITFKSNQQFGNSVDKKSMSFLTFDQP